MRIVFSKVKSLEWIVYGGSSIPYQSTLETPFEFLQAISDEELVELYSSAQVVFVLLGMKVSQDPLLRLWPVVHRLSRLVRARRLCSA